MEAAGLVECPACGGSTGREVRSVEGYRRGDFYRIDECGDCGTQFTPHPQIPPELYDSIYRHSRVLPGYGRYWGYAAAAERFRWPLHYLGCAEEMYWGVEQLVKGWPRADRRPRLLEVGSGLGYVTAAVRAAGWDARGIDLSSRAVREARDRFGPWFEARDADSLADEGERFDVILALELIEHLPNPAAFLATLLQILDPGGAILVSTPNRTRYPSASFWQTELPPVHVQWFTEPGLEALVARSGGTMTLLDLTEFNRIAPGRSSPPKADLPPPIPVLDENFEPLQARDPAPRPTFRGRVMRYPFAYPALVLARGLRRRPGSLAGADRAYSMVAVIRPRPADS